MQQALTGAGPARNWAELSSAMTELAGVQGRSAFSSQGPYWHGLHERLLSYAGRSAARELLQALDGLQAAADRTSVEFGSWHGDWTPWNMAMSAGRAMVWDWERFQAGIPVGYDAVHYRLQQAVAGGRVAAPSAAEAALAGAPAVLAPFGVPARGGAPRRRLVPGRDRHPVRSGWPGRKRGPAGRCQHLAAARAGPVRVGAKRRAIPCGGRDMTPQAPRAESPGAAWPQSPDLTWPRIMRLGALGLVTDIRDRRRDPRLRGPGRPPGPLTPGCGGRCSSSARRVQVPPSSATAWAGSRRSPTTSSPG